jgi:hypothetical protein
MESDYEVEELCECFIFKSLFVNIILMENDRCCFVQSNVIFPQWTIILQTDYNSSYNIHIFQNSLSQPTVFKCNSITNRDGINQRNSF